MYLNCVIVGEQTLPFQCAQILLGKGHRIRGVVTDDAQFRAWADSQNIPSIPSSGDLTAFANSVEFDCLLSIVNGKILPDAFVERASKYAINFHDGPLPELAGFNVTTWALLEGAARHAITWHGIGSKIDAGDIYKQVVFDIGSEESAFTLNAKCYEAALGSFGDLVDQLASGTGTRTTQDLGKRRYIGRYRRPSCVLDFQSPAEQLQRTFRALDFGSYPNPMGAAKFWDGEGWVLVSGLSVDTEGSPAAPGTILTSTADEARIRTATAVVTLRQPRRVDGAAWTGEPGRVLRSLSPSVTTKLTEAHSQVSRREPFWVSALAKASPLTLGRELEHLPAAASYLSLPVSKPAAFSNGDTEPGVSIAAAFLANLIRTEGLTRFDVGFQGPAQHVDREIPAGTFATAVPLRVDTEIDRSFGDLAKETAAAMRACADHGTFPTDLFARYPELRGKSRAEKSLRYAVGIRLLEAGQTTLDLPVPGQLLTLVVSKCRTTCELHYNPALVSEREAEVRRDRLTATLAAASSDPAIAISNLPLMDESERRLLIEEWNDTTVDFDDQCIHRLFEIQAAQQPQAIAVVFEDQQITYAGLNARANQVANHLRALGAGPERVVAIYMDRSIDLLVGLFGILKSGAAYLPIDSSLPAGRRDYMLENSGASIVLTEEKLAGDLGQSTAQVVRVDTDWAEIVRFSAANPNGGAEPRNLAYVIYTSGSTGQPKGVCLTHRNVANFFAGMDERIGGDGPGSWLAVTSISFDISVLELFWTLARGFKVVLAGDSHRALVNRQTAAHRSNKPLDFSLFYFAANENEIAGREQYRLLMEGARFADSHDFHAVWTPERHFHSFGAPYPNPSVTSAAIAAITNRVQIRAGSVVLPLHHPVRVAEEWSIVDNLSDGRVGISFASGWHARDFMLAPQNYADAKGVMFRNIETVRRLWKGEALEFADGTGKQTPVTIRPRPVQSDLPVWVTAAGNPETFRLAGENGYNLLTHLLGQNIQDLAKKIEIYREARRTAGFDPEAGRVTLMLHTFVGETHEQARETARRPMKHYLGTSLDLIKNAPWSFPAFTNKPGLEDVKSANLSTLSAEDMDAILDYAFDRYFETSGLFGTVDECVEIAARVRQIGVDEIACLVDFGVETELALRNLDLLDQVRRTSQSEVVQDYSLPAQMAAHGVTHLQCTPSMAKMLVASPDARASLKSLKKMMVGGEALPGGLARELVSLVGGEVHNMYGPTETTIWSTTDHVRNEAVTIGRPIANTSIYILGPDMQPAPTGTAGDLYIGGVGVAREYMRRPDLTADRFLADPFRAGERIYKTGDLARYAWDGSIEFLGRSDFQVKVRGFRIELGEIETVLNRYPGVRDSVVVARQQDDDAVLTAYFVHDAAMQAGAEELRAWLRQHLPDYMAPAFYVPMDAFPLTHNGKIDRKALPEPQQAAPERTIGESQRPAGEMEQLIADLWRRSLKRNEISVDDNFFDIGGHSILVVQINAELRQALHRDIGLVDMFRFPTIRSLAAFLSAGRSDEGLQDSSNRAKLRQSLAANRRGARRLVPEATA